VSCTEKRDVQKDKIEVWRNRIDPTRAKRTKIFDFSELSEHVLIDPITPQKKSKTHDNKALKSLFSPSLFKSLNLTGTEQEIPSMEE
jgi:hypothetical protein